MDDQKSSSSTDKETNSPVELEQPSVFANHTLENTLLDCSHGDENNGNEAATLSPAGDKVHRVVDVSGTGECQVNLTDGLASNVPALSNLDSSNSERDVILESNKNQSSALTNIFKENLINDDLLPVDEPAPGLCETPRGEEMQVDASSGDNTEEKAALLDNQKRYKTPSCGDEVVSLHLDDATENIGTDDKQHDLEILDHTDKEENSKVVTRELCSSGHAVALENEKTDDAVSSTENIILQKSHTLQPEKPLIPSAEDKFGYNESEQSVSISSADLNLAQSRDVKDTVSDNIKSNHVTESFGSNRSENVLSELVTDGVPEEVETKLVEKKQVTSNFVDHVEELDYEENDDDGSGRLEKLKDNQENKQGDQSDKDEGELTDDDCEEGEIKEPGSRKMFVKPLCRFFQRGSCSWGPGCRFLHPGVNDKGNYQLIEMPGCAPAGIRSRLGVPAMWPEQPEEEVQLPPPPVPDIPLVETAWERGLRLAKERKKAAERKEKEVDFEEKRLNLSVDKEWELNKENEHQPVVAPKDPYYDLPEYEVDEYYKVPREPWPPGQYQNSQVRYNQDRTYAAPYQDKPPIATSARFDHLYGPPEDKFDRARLGLQEPIRVEATSFAPSYTPSLKRPDEWTDPWMRSKSPKNTKGKTHRTSRGKRKHRSASDDSHSSRSRSKSSGSSRSSRSYSSSSGSSSRSRSAGPAAPGLDRRGYPSPSRDQSSIGMSARGAYPGYYQNNRGQGRYQRGGYHVSNGSGGYYGNSYGGGGAGPAGGYTERNMRDRSPGRPWKSRGRSPPDRPLPYVRPRPKSGSSNSDSSRSRSRSRNRISSSRSRSSSRSSRSSSSSSSSARSADSDHLYRDLGNPSKNVKSPASRKKSRVNNGPPLPTPPSSVPAFRLDQIPHPQDPKPPPPLPASGKAEPKYASRNAPPPPVKAKDPLKVVGQKSNIKLTLLPKSSLGNRPNPLDSPPRKRPLEDSDISSPESSPPAKQPHLAMEASVLRLASEKAAKLEPKPTLKPLPVSIPRPASSSTSSLPTGPQVKAATLPQRQPGGSVKPRGMEPAVTKTVPKALVANTPTTTTPAPVVAKPKKTAVSRREELLKQLKAVEDAIAKKKGKLP
ncbi:unnamed protein product [Candidula unifasciata]|uniref:C3H1-type domain-containing protein n=1 Tax=Candidula unifasciata TaxID=100452 RepID=A0A8S3Z3C1_9EUPU|nr:unnamed protein product [Candidula unifasciata]